MQILDPLLIVALALNFVALGVSRIRAVVNAVALQGVLLGILPLFVHAARAAFETRIDVDAQLPPPVSHGTTIRRSADVSTTWNCSGCSRRCFSMHR